MAALALWHTVDSNARLFGALLAELAPDIPLEHRVRADLVAAAQPHGLTPTIRREAALDMLDMADAGAPVVLCTCSTLGPAAESAADLTDAAVLRVDRPMIERALDQGPRIAVAATAPSTLGPTRDLLERAARARGLVLQARDILVADAWPLLQAGDTSAYVERITVAIRERLGEADAVILAQASMAPAAERLKDVPVPVLSSPRLGAEAAVAAYRRGCRPVR
jgi:Asp/Glu/hydantoin racemase